MGLRKKAAQNNVRSLNNDYTREQNHQLASKKVSKQHKHRRLVVMLGIAAVFILMLGFQIYQGQTKLAEMQKQVTTVKGDLADKKTKQSILKNEIRQLQDDGYVLKLVRDKFYLSKDGETIYSFPDDQAKK